LIDSNDYDNSFASAFDGHIAQADPETSADDAEIEIVRLLAGHG